MIDRRVVLAGAAALAPGIGKAQSRWTAYAPIPWPVQEVYGTARRGRAVIAGGGRWVGGGNSAQLDRYDPSTDRWETLRPMPRAAGGLGAAAAGWRRTPRHGLAVVALGGRVYAIGGGVRESGAQVSAMAQVLTP